jgi:colicin import membrane protein
LSYEEAAVDQIEELPPKKRTRESLMIGVGCGLLGLNLLFTAINWGMLNSVSSQQKLTSESSAEATENVRAMSTKLANLTYETQAQAGAVKKQIGEIRNQVDELTEVANRASAAAAEANFATAGNHEETNRQIAKLLAKIPSGSTSTNNNSFDDLIIRRISSQWKYPEDASAGKRAELIIKMQPDGTISAASIATSSGDPNFDTALVDAVRNVSRIPELANLNSEAFNRLYAERKLIYTGNTKAL